MLLGDELSSMETPLWESEPAAESASIVLCDLGNLHFSQKALEELSQQPLQPVCLA